MKTPKWIIIPIAVNLIVSILATALFAFQNAGAKSAWVQTIPGTITYQGMLTDQNGAAINGTKDIVFGIYINEVVSAPLWQETHPLTNIRNGAFSVRLGRYTPFPEGLFNQPGRWLGIRIDGEELTPRQRFTSVPYAFNADTLDGYDSSDFLANSQANSLPAGAVVYLPEGATVAGYHQKTGAPAMDLGSWQPFLSPYPCNGQNLNLTAWSGSKLFRMSLLASSTFAGVIYDKASNTWQPMSAENAPVTDNEGVAAWTGSRLLVYTGKENGSRLYNPQDDTWSPISTVNGPSQRNFPSIVWAGQKLFVWGGVSSSGMEDYLGDGALYDPAQNTWTPINSLNAPTPRYGAYAIWAGSKVLLMFGETAAARLTDGSIYDLSAGTWSPLNNIPAGLKNQLLGGAATPRYVWTGTEAVIRWMGSLYFYNTNTETWRVQNLGLNSNATAIGFNGEVIYSEDGVYDLQRQVWIPVAGRDIESVGPENIFWAGDGWLFASQDSTVEIRLHAPELYAPFEKE